MADDDAVTLVLLHPVGLNGSTFSLLGLHDAVAPDLLGHGGRERRPGMTMADLADDVLAQCPGRLDVVGVSMGAMVGLHLALDHPARVRSLLVACSGAAADPATMAARAAAAERGMAGVLDETLTRWFTPEALSRRHHPGVERARQALLAMDPFAFADGWRAIGGHDVAARLGELDLPLTCLAGRRDLAAPPERLLAIAEAVSGARFVVLEAPHIVHLEEPEAFATAIAAHLGGIGDR
ncbi:MAG TPA: alpha/beta hydrolase [Acidimicrobiales bacterium]|nr:alpha/beta hydrolase [Acidimicrobiales bacterium]